MLKRIAYLGLSYPSLYDYQHLAKKAKNDLSDSPNPIIDSPLGLMILYDELWFLCESLCPNNMRNLPYVKFVDVMFPNLWFEGAEEFSQDNILDINSFTRLSYGDISKRMNLSYGGLDTHTHTLQIGNIRTSSNGGLNNYLFDLYVLSALQNFTDKKIEMVSNPNYSLNEEKNLNAVSELTEKLIISDIPNYLSIDGPYHKCIEQLRENEYLMDFRKWIISHHSNIQHNEIKDICSDVSSNIKETQKNIFKKYLEDNNKYSMFKSTSKTIISTVGGFFHPGLSIADMVSSISTATKRSMDAKLDRWQGFIIDAKDISNKFNN